MDEKTDVDGTLTRKVKARELMGVACEMILLAADHGLCMFAVAEGIEHAAFGVLYGEASDVDRRALCSLAAWCRQCAPADRSGLPLAYWERRAALFEKAAMLLSGDDDEKLAA